MKLNKKGQVFKQLAGLAIGIAVIAIVLVVTFMIISQGQQQICSVEGIASGSCSSSQASIGVNATNDIALAVDDIPGWLPLVIIVGIGSILIGMVSVFSRNR